MPLSISRSAMVLPSVLAPAMLLPRALASLSAFSVLEADASVGPAQVVDALRVDVGHAAEHAQPRPLGRPVDPLPLPAANPLASIFDRLDLHGYFAPVFPAFFFSTSPV
jgi:hypothetical protein